MGKSVKKLTNLTVHMKPGTTQIITITIAVKDIKLLVDKNGFVVAKDGKVSR